jgi:hypothetical protein
MMDRRNEKDECDCVPGYETPSVEMAAKREYRSRPYKNSSSKEK